MIASSSCTLRASSSRSACKSCNIFKLTSYQRSRAVRFLHQVTGVLLGAGLRSLPECPSVPLFPTARDLILSDPPRPLTFCPAYSPWIPIIVSRIKTLSAKIFRASRIWCMPSPCGDRYSRQVTGAAAKPSACHHAKTFRLFSYFILEVKRVKHTIQDV